MPSFYNEVHDCPHHVIMCLLKIDHKVYEMLICTGNNMLINCENMCNSQCLPSQYWKHKNYIWITLKKLSHILYSEILFFGYYLQQGSVFICISLFVSWIMQKLLDLFSQNLVKRWHMGHRRNHYCGVNLDYIRIRVKGGLGLGEGTTILCMVGCLAWHLIATILWHQWSWQRYAHCWVPL